MSMLAFHGKRTLKVAMLREVRKHENADQIVAGHYGMENGKWTGCAVGCSIRSLALIQKRKLDTSDHMLFESEAGVPVMLARLQDTLFEGLPESERVSFPRKFWTAIQPSADLSRVGWKFLYWLLTEELEGRDHPLVRDAIKQCADVLVPLTKGRPVDASAAWSAESAAWSAAWSAEGAARSAARSAASAARSTESAAWSAASAARSTESAAYTRMAAKLIALLKTAPVPKRKAA
jgi:hypothetical protein